MLGENEVGVLDVLRIRPHGWREYGADDFGKVEMKGLGKRWMY